ncbi:MULTISPECIES: DMT family transporter [Anoxybacillus]|uniref:Putative permease, DMT superfamily n=1 Tax=Anoxybacillus ayderensis TaxID=265546 RepID=A0A0D0G763_9BACL|nr:MULTISPECIES: DMT family transporter [Anoxybacillus]EPZ39779.1 drug/metabolite transporter (DMT) superfamily permease [Anoxybacillus ayderensis]KIP21235.1 putative permease, DMT superfamily [Anoxybacillus ayderensis]NNU96103.1 DMT family transporter [Anoxybacillus sp. EFIL]
MKAYIALIIGALSISTSAIFVKFTDAPSAVIAFYRLFFAVVFMTPLFIVKHIRETKQMNKKDWAFAVLSGTLLAFHFILWFESLRYTSVASSVVLVTLQPIFAFVGGFFFFKEKMTMSEWVSALLAILGSVIISWGDFRVSGEALYGDMLALIACAMVTGYWLVGQHLRKQFSLITYTYIVYGIASLVLSVYVSLFRYSFLSYNANDWWCFVLLAVIPTLFGHSLFNWAMKWVNAAMVSMAILFEPIGAIILAYIWLDEKVYLSQGIGSFFIIVGIGAYILGKHIKNNKKIVAFQKRT